MNGTAGAIYLVGFGVLVAFISFAGALTSLVGRWSSEEEYSHGFLIPILALWLLWDRRVEVGARVGKPAWSGAVLVLVAAVVHIFGSLSATNTLSQLSFILTIIGLVLAFGGYSLLRTILVPILVLLFAIPMPRIIDLALSFQLQLLSSELGTLFIRMFQIPVQLDGNVVDLGNFKLQVAEACSGLRYIYPLLSLSFFAAYLFQGPLWQRVFVFVSSIPITIVMNSLRISLVGLTVTYWGNEAADGFIHLFEGWIIFMACAALIALEIYVLARLSGKKFFDVFYRPKANIKPIRKSPASLRSQLQLVVSLLFLCVGGATALQISARAEIVPNRPRFVEFPQQIGSWRGHPSLLDPAIQRALGLDDYILSDFQEPYGNTVNLYVAYSASQRNSDVLHSPSVCIPGSGWRVIDFKRTSYFNEGLEIPLNRVVIEKNSVRQLVYYWFDERGRKVANEYVARWYLHVDAILKDRTDGSLIRLVTRLNWGESESDADNRLQAFMRAAMPSLSKYLPSSTASGVQSTLFKSNEGSFER